MYVSTTSYLAHSGAELHLITGVSADNDEFTTRFQIIINIAEGSLELN